MPKGRLFALGLVLFSACSEEHSATLPAPPVAWEDSGYPTAPLTDDAGKPTSLPADASARHAAAEDAGLTAERDAASPGDAQIADAAQDSTTATFADASLVDAAARVNEPSDAGAVLDASEDAGAETGSDAQSSPDASNVASGFYVKGVVHGLHGSGLSLVLNATTVLNVQGDQFQFPLALSDGDHFSVSVLTQPAAPAALCSLVQSQASIAGQDAVLDVKCEPLGGLRISEVGSCYYFDSACWFELYNAGGADEDLSAYALRTSAAQGASPYAFDADHTFELPEYSLKPGAYAVIAAASSAALPDGQGMLHIRDQSFLPWWNDSGFVELLSQGRSVDFLRFGESSAQPTTPGTFDAQNAPALENGPLSYGYSLARSESSVDTNRAADFSARAFATPHGPNDVTSDVDADQDGLPDAAEVPGTHFAGLDLYAMGARLGVRDVFVEIDRMDSKDPALTPLRAGLDRLVAAFAAQNIALHLDVGDVFSASFDPQSYNLGGGDVVPFAAGVDFPPTASGVADVYAYKAAHMRVERRAVFYYMLFGYSQSADGSAGSAGVGELWGNDSIITLGGYGFTTFTARQRNLLANYQASTMMHELGHNLGLRHGGDEDVNYKPNYVSVMNYLYGSLGLPVIGDREGDRYDLTTNCSLWFVSDLQRPPTASPSQFQLDFSHGESADIDEAHVFESEGVGRVNSTSVDYDCSSAIEDDYAADLNFDGKLSTLRDYDDWANVHFVFARTRASNDSAFGFASRVVVATDVHLDDHQGTGRVPCPKLPLRTQ